MMKERIAKLLEMDGEAAQIVAAVAQLANSAISARVLASWCRGEVELIPEVEAVLDKYALGAIGYANGKYWDHSAPPEPVQMTRRGYPPIQRAHDPDATPVSQMPKPKAFY